MSVAINGAGVAGPTLAYWLRRFGHEPVLFEKAPALRTGGYLIDFWGGRVRDSGAHGADPDPAPTLLRDGANAHGRRGWPRGGAGGIRDR